jgi:hypothetical protein
VQVQATHPCDPAARALSSLLARSHAMLPSALAHPLQAVRASGSQLLALCLAALLSPRPLLTGAAGAPAGCSGDALIGMVRDVVQRGADALAAADSAAPPSDLGTPGNATEASIGSAAALAQALATTSALQPLVLDVLVDTVVPWVIDAQSLQSPDLQGLMLQLRSLVVAMKCIVPGVHCMPALLATLQEGAARPAWQARASALALLQVTWFRWAPRALPLRPTGE